jgi:hypothetical protein
VPGTEGNVFSGQRDRKVIAARVANVTIRQWALIVFKNPVILCFVLSKVAIHGKQNEGHLLHVIVCL